MNIRLSTLDAGQVRPLRHAILRPHAPITRSIYAGDEEASTRHFGAFYGNNLIGVATLLHEANPLFSLKKCWRLRGMAVRPDARRKGVGTALVKACLNHVASLGGGIIWCYARVNALPFYDTLGFQRIEGVIHFQDSGAHVLLYRLIEPDSSFPHVESLMSSAEK